MRFTLFEKRAAQPMPLRVPQAEELQATAAAFIAAVVNESTPDQIRAIELASMNGSLALRIQTKPSPRITLMLDPGQPINLEVS
jgi:hypothetical protein